MYFDIGKMALTLNECEIILNDILAFKLDIEDSEQRSKIANLLDAIAELKKDFNS